METDPLNEQLKQVRSTVRQAAGRVLMRCYYQYQSATPEGSTLMDVLKQPDLNRAFHTQRIQFECAARSKDLAGILSNDPEKPFVALGMLTSENATGKGDLYRFDQHTVCYGWTKQGIYFANSPANSLEYIKRVYLGRSMQDMLTQIKTHCGGYWLEDRAEELKTRTEEDSIGGVLIPNYSNSGTLLHNYEAMMLI